MTDDALKSGDGATVTVPLGNWARNCVAPRKHRRKAFLVGCIGAKAGADCRGLPEAWSSGLSRCYRRLSKRFRAIELLEGSDQLGTPYAVINNAAIFPRSFVVDTHLDEWERVLRINLTAPFLLDHHLLRGDDGGQRGVVINVASTVGLRGDPRGAHYASSKAGLIALTKSYAQALGPSGIRVNCILPGISDTAQPLAGMTRDELLAKAATSRSGGLDRLRTWRASSRSSSAPTRSISAASRLRSTARRWRSRNSGDWTEERRSGPGPVRTWLRICSRALVEPQLAQLRQIVTGTAW